MSTAQPPPPYNTEVGPPPPQAPYDAPQPGYNYPPQQQPVQPGQPGYQGYPTPSYPNPPPVQQQQQTSNVIVVQQQQQAVIQQQVIHRRDTPNHCLHCVITFFCPWYLLIWIIICCVYGC